MTTRLCVDVVNELLAVKQQKVRDYRELVDTPNTIDELVGGTSFFPGGRGVWCGNQPYAPMPRFFPEAPYMFVGHNWFNEKGFKEARAVGFEPELAKTTGLWASLLAYLKAAKNPEGESIEPSTCFFTNAFMGLIPGAKAAVGSISEYYGPDFPDECRTFLHEQIRIVQPRMVVIMGNEARRLLQGYDVEVPLVFVPHPSSHRAVPADLVRTAEKKVENLILALAAEPFRSGEASRTRSADFAEVDAERGASR